MNRREFLLASAVGAAIPALPQVSTLPRGLLAAEHRPLPAFSLPDVDGTIVRSSDFKGNVLLLRFWATW